MKPMLKPPGTRHLKLKCDILVSTFAFKFNLRRYTTVAVAAGVAGFDSIMVGRCGLTVSKSAFKAPMVSALEATI